MMRLVRRGLMFGNLFEVRSASLVERYNRALEHLTGKRTELTEFHIDISGYSPEIGDELGDDLYLNPNGCNRQFILLSTDQKTAPLLNVKFSTSRSVLRKWMEANEDQLFALTARDAVAGELVNSVYSVEEPVKLFDIRKVQIEADTTTGTVAEAEALARDVDRFLSEEDAWFDDVLIAEMITLAGQTGDVVRNPIDLKEMSFDQRNFWTAHFGGLYIFQGLDLPGVIAVDDKEKLGELPVEYLFDLGDRNRIANYLDLNGLVEPIVKARGLDAGAILRQKMDFILVDALADTGVPLHGRTRTDMRRLARQNADRLPDEFHALSDLLNWAENNGRWPQITSEHPAYFYTLRAARHLDADLVNMLLAELAPKDARQLFICHKELFYQHYDSWSDSKKDYVVDYLVNEYMVDKLGTREALFGHEAAMQEPDPRADLDALVARVGPWGPVRR